MPALSDLSLSIIPASMAEDWSLNYLFFFFLKSQPKRYEMNND